MVQLPSPYFLSGRSRFGRWSSQGADDHGEGVRALELCGIDGCSHVRFRLGGPHGAVSIGDFSLDHAGTEFALRGVVGDVDLAGIVTKGEKLVSRAPDFCLQLSRQIAPGWRGQKNFELSFQISLFPR